MRHFFRKRFSGSCVEAPVLSCLRDRPSLDLEILQPVRRLPQQGELEQEDPSLIQSICGLGRLEGSPCTLPRPWAMWDSAI
jgi:hypothetical protein